MRATYAGPGTNQYSVKQDSGKQQSAGSGGGYRRAGQAAGPGSSHSDYKSTQDAG
eukprot:CAMPEP_0201487280 /NCGR_PEP_ID=MMETSP0151_2-20130828/12138_1 /ASSEMBLY_ACC=CAM_ASM_000257 /TAXON_ID=200890 /ORGANISM="Paramoeba atlantica, Strain 621/1 / CCAP 1560/9" /LENGTH=54 /DNA_ID=CAMNT_0047872279 /DNA_START=21 /DNA_END=182 /DNA_ORIENTATION=+